MPTGVLLSNLGTPDAPTPEALRRYLRQFLSDRRVVDLARPLWLPILHGIILRVRPRRSAAAYRTVWTDEGSPLMVISRHQAAALQEELEQRAPGAYRVALGMRYGNPSIASAITELRAAGCDDVAVLPLYPQFSCSTSASTFDAVAEAITPSRDLPGVRFIRDYHRHPGYVRALASSIREAWSAGEPAEKLLFSFHGTPERYRAEGDPYHAQCRSTAEAVAAELELPATRWQLVFQSRFGREPWLQPYTDVTLEALAGQGVKSVDIVCPGFSADCLETLEEIAEEAKASFLKAGGEQFRYIPALNERADHIALMADLVAGT